MAKGFVYVSLSFFMLACLVIAQRETTTKGKSGAACGKNRRCIKKATCDAKKTCQCPNNYKGNGKLGCVKEEEMAIYLQADPQLKNLLGETIPIQTPCPYRLLKYNTPDLNRVEIYADNHLYIGGNFYANRLEARFFIKKENSNFSVLIEGTADNGVYKFKEWRKGDNDITWTTPNEDTEVVNELEIKISYDVVDNFATIDAEDSFGLFVRFRPAEANKEIQLQVPGIVIALTEGIMHQIHFSKNELSSTPEGPSVVALATENKVSLTNWGIYSSMNNVEVIDSVDKTCNEVYYDFKGTCTDKTLRLAAVRACGALYSDPTFLKCVARSNVTEDFQATLYKLCQRALCTKDYTNCEILHTKILDISCDVPRGLSFCSAFYES